MLKVDKPFVDALRAGDKDALVAGLHRAMRLEAATIPPYYAAAWSIKNSQSGDNPYIYECIVEVAKEEMLHMMAIANIISALGVIPKIASEEMVLNWGQDFLPTGGDLKPSLGPFSLKQLAQFMEIEKPKDPKHYVVIEEVLEEEAFGTLDATIADIVDKEFATIGEFYEALIELINSFPEDPFSSDSAGHQIELRYHPQMSAIDHNPITSFLIKDRQTAIEILNWVVDQGEGSDRDPLDGNNTPAHYYQFAQIYKGGKLVEAPDEELKYAYDLNQPIQFDQSGVTQFQPNPKMNQFAEGSVVFQLQLQFNKSYVEIFDSLQKFYEDGKRRHLRRSIFAMVELTSPAMQLLELGVGPSFEWIE